MATIYLLSYLILQLYKDTAAFVCMSAKSVKSFWSQPVTKISGSHTIILKSKK